MPFASLDEAYQTFGEIRGIKTGTQIGGNHQFGHQMRGQQTGQQFGGYMGQIGGYQTGGHIGHQHGGDQNQVADLGDLANQQSSDRQDLYELANNYKSDNYNFIYSGKKDWAVINKDISKLQAPTNSTIAPEFNPLVAPTQSITNDSTILTSLGMKTGPPSQTQASQSNLDQIQNNFIRSNLATANNLRVGSPANSAESDSLRNYLNQTGQVVARNPQDLRPVTMIPAPQQGANIDRFLNESGLGQKKIGQTKQCREDGCSDNQCLSDLNHILSCDDCVLKLRKLIGGQQSFLGLDLPDLNLAKMIFWIAVVFLIVAVYEMLNRSFGR